MGDAADSRRAFLTAGIGVLGAGLAGVTIVPGTIMLAFPLDNATTSGGQELIPVGKLDRFPEGKPVRVDLFADIVDAWNRVEQAKVGSAWVINRGGELVAFSTVCPHLGCAVDFDAETGKFRCPCHKSAFAIDGQREEGPSPRDLDTLELATEDRLVSIRHQRFREGLSDKEPV